VVSNAGFADRRLVARSIVPLGRLAGGHYSAFFELATAAKPWLVKAGSDVA